MNNCISYINNKLSENPQLCHSSNLIGKWDKFSSLKKRQQEALKNIIPQYYNYLCENFKLIGFSDDIIVKRVNLLNEYYNFLHDNGYDNVFSSQGKFRPTILEEFIYILFKDYVNNLKTKYNDINNVLNSGSAKAYTNLYFTSNNFESFVVGPSIEINIKNQDFAIYRDFALSVNGKNQTIKIPVVAIEDKTYIDKTMLDGIIATAEKIKTGNPYSLFIVIAENYDVDLSVDPAYSRIDQIYVLRKCKRKELENNWIDIDPVVVIRIFKDVDNHITRPWSNVENKMRTEGVII